jgi:hypothetical protein
VRRLTRLAGIVAAIGAAAGLALGGVAASAAAAPPPPTGGPVQPNIVGGNPPSHAYPAGAFAALHYDAPEYGITNHFTCGAAQLNGHFLRTAAHCVTDMPAGLSADAKARLLRFYGLDAKSAAIPTAAKQFWVRIGSPDRTSGGVVVRASVHWVDPGWAWGNSPESDDVAELQVDEYLTTAPLPIASRAAQPGDTVYSLGWGGTEPVFDGNLPVQIQELQRKIVPAVKCADAGITTRDVCADNPQGVRGDCYGDSGGPLLVLKNGIWYDVGITSRGGSQFCGVTPDVYTSTPEFTKELYKAMLPTPAGRTHGVPVR